MNIIAGFLLAAGLAILGHSLSHLIGSEILGMTRSPTSPVMIAILLGILVRNTVGLPVLFAPGVRFCLVRILQLGIILLGIRLSLVQVGQIGLRSLPIILGVVTAAILTVTFISRRTGLSGRLGTLIAVGTSICGATAIMAMAPTIAARDDEVAYAVACITLFGVMAMIVYPFAAYWLFDADAFRSGLFLGTSVHDTAQAVGSGLLYEEYFGHSSALNTAMVTKLVRNLCLIVVIPVMSVLHHRHSCEGTKPPAWWSMVPLFIAGFVMMSLIRTIGDIGDHAFGLIPVDQWHTIVVFIKNVAEWCLIIAMAAVGLGTSIKNLLQIGLKPLGVGFFSAVVVGVVSFSLITLLY